MNSEPNFNDLEIDLTKLIEKEINERQVFLESQYLHMEEPILRVNLKKRLK